MGKLGGYLGGVFGGYYGRGGGGERRAVGGDGLMRHTRNEGLISVRKPDLIEL